MQNHPLLRTPWPIGLLALILLGCQPDTGQPTATGPAAAETPPSTAAAQTEYWAAWESSPHAHTYALEKGPNTYCARCHAPQNWEPAAEIDPPPNCVSCKFPNEPEPRQAQSNVLIPEAKWLHIGCPVCHRLQNGIAAAEVAWLDVRTNYYETVASPTALCQKCHTDTESLRHGRDLSTSAHAGFECTDCHDAHTVAANCTDSGCHTDFTARYPVNIAEHTDQVENERCTECHASVADIHMNILDETPVACLDCHQYLIGEYAQTRYQSAHSIIHATVRCAACHDGSDLAVGQPPGQERWVTFRTTALLGRETTAPYQSHNIQLTVTCERCHYTGNPWGLAVDIEELPDAPSAR